MNCLFGRLGVLVVSSSCPNSFQAAHLLLTSCASLTDLQLGADNNLSPEFSTVFDELYNYWACFVTKFGHH